jgi:hypothetical protein
MIGRLIDVTPVRKRVPVSYDTGWHQVRYRHHRRSYGTVPVWVTEYIQERNEQAKNLLYQYTAQDLGYDQEQWRKAVLQPLRESQRNPRDAAQQQ